jgi:hypothetical protein
MTQYLTLINLGDIASGWKTPVLSDDGIRMEDVKLVSCWLNKERKSADKYVIVISHVNCDQLRICISPQHFSSVQQRETSENLHQRSSENSHEKARDLMITTNLRILKSPLRLAMMIHTISCLLQEVL